MTACKSDEQPASGMTSNLQASAAVEDVVQVIDDTPMLVRPGLFIGSMLVERSKPRLRAANITDVLQVAEGLYPHFPMEFGYMNIQVADSPAEDLVVHFTRAFDYIDKVISRGGGVLVHCAAGVSRSSTLVLGYLMSRDGMTFDDAYSHLRSIRPWVCPNPGFVAQLQEYERLGKDSSKWRAWRHVWSGTHDPWAAAKAAGPTNPLPAAAALVVPKEAVGRGGSSSNGGGGGGDDSGGGDGPAAAGSAAAP